MGSLLVLLVVLSQHVNERAVAKGASSDNDDIATAVDLDDASASPSGEPALSVDQLVDSQDPADLAKQLELAREREMEYLERRAEEEQARDEERARLTHIEDHSRRLEHELAKLQITHQRLLQAERDQVVDQEQAEAELQRLEELAAEAREQLEEMQAGEASKKSYAIVPYRGSNGTFRQPIYIECTAQGVVIQPVGVVLGSDDFAFARRAGNPLASAMRAANEYLNAQARQRGEEEAPDPYPLLIVRPGGADAYLAATTAITAGGSDYGYEFVEQDTALEFPSADPRLGEVIHHAVLQARDREAVLAQLAPSRYARVGGDRLSGTVGSGAPGSGFGMGNGGAGGSPFEGSGGTASGDRYGAAGDGSSGPDLIGAQPGAGGYAATLGGGAGNGEGSGAYGPGAYGGGAAGTSDGAFGDGVDAMLDANGGGEYSQANGGQAGTDATGEANAGNSGGAGGTEGGSPGGQASPGGRYAGSNAQNGSGGSSTGGAAGAPGGQPNGAAGNGASLSFGGAPQGAAAQGASQAGASPSGASLVQSRGKGWAVGGQTDSTAALRRPIQVVVHRDRLTILPSRHVVDPQLETGAEVRFDQSADQIADQLAAALQNHMTEWGLAGRGLYWSPVLVTHVSPGAEQQAAQLSRLLAGSGVDVQLPATAQSAGGASARGTR
ncbi:MAG: hypothetical protein KDA61_17500, partial [Planctomycetales bacterium]|nr:hypothetical protein [Planctomycetales bacterium]